MNTISRKSRRLKKNFIKQDLRESKRFLYFSIRSFV